MSTVGAAFSAMGTPVKVAELYDAYQTLLLFSTSSRVHKKTAMKAGSLNSISERRIC